jgi:hypothetical protein
MKTILTLLFGLSTLITSAQEITKNYLIGKWEKEDKSGFVMNFSLDDNGELKTELINAITGDDIKVLSMRIKNGTLYLNTLNEHLDWYAYNEYTKIDENTMEVFVKNDEGLFKLIYKRKKL